MTDNSCGNWGSGAIGFVLGAALTGNGGLFGNNNCGKGCGPCGNAVYGQSAVEAKLDDIMDGQDTKAILDASIAGSSAIRADIGALTKDVYSLNVQQLINDQAAQRALDNQFCVTREYIAADGEKTRGAIDAFKQLYQTDRYNDLARENAELKNRINVMPLECGLASVNSKLSDILCPGAVRTCGSTCSNNCGASLLTQLPPMVGTSTTTRSYNPSIPTA